MNYDWIDEQLQSFIDEIDSYRGRVESTGRLSVPPVSEDHLLQRCSVVKEVVDAVLPGSAWMLGRRGYNDTFDQVRDVALQALGLVRAHEELAANLATPAPQLAADGFHPWVWNAAQSLWDTGHYRAAVQAAATSVDLHLQALVNRRDVTGKALVEQCLSSDVPAPAKPRLRVQGERDSPTWRSQQDGLRHLAVGCFEALRNPATHELVELQEGHALEQLATLSLLARMLGDCEVEAA